MRLGILFVGRYDVPMPTKPRSQRRKRKALIPPDSVAMDPPKHLMPVISQERQDAYIRALMKGYSPQQVACKLAPENKRRQRALKGQIQWVAGQSEEFLAWQAGRAKGAVVGSVPEMAEAMVRRGKRGRTDAIKLGLEMTNIHNPRVKHEHSGDISINLNMPRPGRVDNPSLDDPSIVDAEVVDD